MYNPSLLFDNRSCLAEGKKNLGLLKKDKKSSPFLSSLPGCCWSVSHEIEVSIFSKREGREGGLFVVTNPSSYQSPICRRNLEDMKIFAPETFLQKSKSTLNIPYLIYRSSVKKSTCKIARFFVNLCRKDLIGIGRRGGGRWAAKTQKVKQAGIFLSASQKCYVAASSHVSLPFLIRTTLAHATPKLASPPAHGKFQVWQCFGFRTAGHIGAKFSCEKQKHCAKLGIFCRLWSLSPRFLFLRVSEDVKLRFRLFYAHSSCRIPYLAFGTAWVPEKNASRVTVTFRLGKSHSSFFPPKLGVFADADEEKYSRVLALSGALIQWEGTSKKYSEMPTFLTV